MSTEMLQARENLMEAIQAFLKKYDQIPPKEKSMALLLAEERFLKIKQAVKEEQNQPENIQEFDASHIEEDECFDPGGEINKIDAFLDMNISTDIENGYHDSEGDIIYLESLLINDTISNLSPEVFLDHDPKNLKDEPDNEDFIKFIISDDETIDCAFARFFTIITSLKALDEYFSSRNHVTKFLRALPTKWRPKVTTIEESKDLSTLSLDELIDNLKVNEVVLEKDLEIFKRKKEKYKLLALKARKVLSEEETTSLDSDDEEYAMAIQITSLVIVPNTPSLIKKLSLSGVGVIVKMNPRKKKYVSWHLTTMSKAYIVLNKETMKIEESLNVKFDESPPPSSPPLEDDDVLECEILEKTIKSLRNQGK
ncbi:hypothetical protein Tco_0292015 [Tanacetum coccineum]